MMRRMLAIVAVGALLLAACAEEPTVGGPTGQTGATGGTGATGATAPTDPAACAAQVTTSPAQEGSPPSCRSTTARTVAIGTGSLHRTRSWRSSRNRASTLASGLSPSTIRQRLSRVGT